MQVVDNPLAAQLAQFPPLDSLPSDVLETVAAAAEVTTYRGGAVILDAFAEPSNRLYAVLDGTVAIWHDPEGLNQAAQRMVPSGELFGFATLLTGEPAGPKAIAQGPATVAAIPADLVSEAFATPNGARFLAEHVSDAYSRPLQPPSFLLVDDLIADTPVVVEAGTTAAEVARRITDTNWPCAVVQVDSADGARGFGLITGGALLRKIIVQGMPTATPARELMAYPAPTITNGASITDAVSRLIDTEDRYLLVTDRAGDLRGVLAASDFIAAPSTVGGALHDPIRHAPDLDTLVLRSGRIPAMLGDLLDRGLASGRVIAAYSGVVDSLIRRAISLVFASHPDLSTDAFTWLNLGSNGRREAVLSSDVDAAVSFKDGLEPDEQARYRAAFAEVAEVLVRAGLTFDGHGATPTRPAFARTNSEWRSAGQRWLARAREDEGIVMGPLLVDARPIHGDPGLPAVAQVFGSFRRHPETMSLLLRESVSHRGSLLRLRGVLSRRDEIDIKAQALAPLVNVARWAALSAGSTELLTTARLRAGAGTKALPAGHAGRLVETFEALQRIRLRYQAAQVADGLPPTDVLSRQRLSRLDRATVNEAIRQITESQRRMENLAEVVPIQDLPEPAAPPSR